MDQIEFLGATPQSLRQMTGYLSDAQWRARPAADEWSPLEVVAHLLDIERELYGVWVLRVLREDRPTLADRFRAAELARERGYNQLDPAATLAAFAAAREATVGALRQAVAGAWDRTWVDREGAAQTARFLLRRFANHDAIHIGQLARAKRSLRAF